MKHLLVSKPLMGLAALLLIVQMACIASSISPTATPGGEGSSASQATQPPTSGSATTQSAPLGGGAEDTQSAPASGGSSTQTAPTTSTSGQATQGVPSTGGQGTGPEGAQQLLNQVVQHYQSAGRQQALKDFTDQEAPFNAPGMFVMCVGSDHKISAMGGFPLLVGISADSINEATGQSMGSLIWDAASADPQGSLPFSWKNPLSGQNESKVIVYQKLSQDVCGVVADQP